MSSLNWWFAALSLVAILFVVWPMLSGSRNKSKKYSDDSDRLALNAALYSEHLDDIQSELDKGAITAIHFEKLKKEYTQQFEQDKLASDQSTKNPSTGHWSILTASLSLPIAALVIYWILGYQADIEIERLNEKHQRILQGSGGELKDLATAEELKAKLVGRLQQRPENLNNRFLLARIAYELGDYRLSLASYQLIVEKHPDSPQVLAEMAQVLYVAGGRKFSSEVKVLFDRSISLDPKNVTIFELAGITAFQSGEYQFAANYWRQGLPLLAGNSPAKERWLMAIDGAMSRMVEAGIEDVQPRNVAEDTDTKADPKVIVNISVSLAEAVDVQASDTVFIYARAWQKVGMPPLAVRRLTVSELPVTIQLDETQVMAPGMPTLADFDEVGISVLISKAGVAQAQPGDWQETIGPIKPKVQSETIVILVDSQVP